LSQYDMAVLKHDAEVLMATGLMEQLGLSSRSTVRSVDDIETQRRNKAPDRPLVRSILCKPVCVPSVSSSHES